MSFGEKVRWWVLDILDREVGSTGAKYRVLVNRVDTSNPDRPEHQP
ncbi:tail fiber assembly protein, partial [Salmonella enterica]|nr:tail fiber assembly protein [Salmonella enterica subsp. enterica serovar Schwarzengrund]